MKTYLMFWLTIGSIQFSFSQNTFTSVIKDSFTLEPLIGVSAKLRTPKLDQILMRKENDIVQYSRWAANHHF